MVVWEDRGVLKPPKPPIVHATATHLLFETTIIIYSVTILHSQIIIVATYREVVFP